MLCGLGPSRFPLSNPAFNAQPAPTPFAPQARPPCGGIEDTFARAPIAGPGAGPCAGPGAAALGNSSPELEQLIQLLRGVLQGTGQQANGPATAGLPLGRDLGALNAGVAGGNWGNGALVQGTGGAGPQTEAAARALDWSAQQMNPATATAVNPNTGMSVAQNPDAWTNYCLKFVSAAYGDQVPELNQNTAFESYKQFAGQGRIQQDRNPPAGAPVFFNQTASTPYGHVGIATGKTDANGDPIIRTTGVAGASGILEVPLSVLEKNSAAYLGWGKI
jgi:hypothetical protein